MKMLGTGARSRANDFEKLLGPPATPISEAMGQIVGESLAIH